MLYIVDIFDPSVFDISHTGQYMKFEMWETKEEVVKGWIESGRSRTIFKKQELVNLFDIGQTIHMTEIQKIKLEKYDKIVLWTKDSRYFAIEIVDFYS